jgi:hypothetical protein
MDRQGALECRRLRFMKGVYERENRELKELPEP